MLRPLRPRLKLEHLEDRCVPAGLFLTGVGGQTDPAQPNVRLYDTSAGSSTATPIPPGDLAAFSGGFNGSVRVASGDVNGDGVDDIITAQGPGAGSGSQVNIYDGASALAGSQVLIASFYVFSDQAGVSQNPGFAGGVFVASADLNGDGYAELIVSAGAGARGHVKVFNFNGGAAGFLGSNPELRSSFYAYTDFAGEVRVTTMNVGLTKYVVTASGAGTTQSDVRMYGGAYTIGQVPDGTFVNPRNQFFPFVGYAGGLSVAAGDINGDGRDELFVSKNSGDSTVYVFDAINTTAPEYQFTAFQGYEGEVRLGAADVNGDGTVEVLTSTGDSPGAEGAHVEAWTFGAAPSLLESFYAYPGYSNGVFLNTNDFHTSRGGQVPVV